MYKLVLKSKIPSNELIDYGISNTLLNDIEMVDHTSYLKMPMVKNFLIETFLNHGYLKRARLHQNHNLFITASNNSKVGLCVQMGHKSGLYFDMFKLAYMHEAGLIRKAIIILPSTELEKFCKTSSVATYELITKQMELFSGIINFKPKLVCVDVKRRD